MNRGETPVLPPPAAASNSFINPDDVTDLDERLSALESATLPQVKLAVARLDALETSTKALAQVPELQSRLRGVEGWVEDIAHKSELSGNAVMGLRRDVDRLVQAVNDSGVGGGERLVTERWGRSSKGQANDANGDEVRRRRLRKG